MQNTKENQATIGNLIDELIDSVVDDNTHDNCVQRQIDKLKQVIFSGGWISVDDKLPPNNTPVLIYLDDDVVVCELGLQNNITIACYDNGHGDDLPCWLSVESQDCSSVVMPIIISPSEVAYWQALPSPPVQRSDKMKCEMKQVSTSKNDLQDLVIYAQRYSIGRQTYAPREVRNFILNHLNDLEYNTIKVIIDDIRLQNEQDNLGADIDKLMWLALLAKVEKTLKTRKELNHDK